MNCFNNYHKDKIRNHLLNSLLVKISKVYYLSFIKITSSIIDKILANQITKTLLFMMIKFRDINHLKASRVITIKIVPINKMIH